MADWFDTKRLDEVLKIFENVKGGKVSSKVLMDKERSPEDWDLAVHFLVEEKYLRDLGDYFEITYKGKMLIHDGGFFRKDRRESLLAYFTIIAAVAAVLALAVSVIALICQMHS